MIGHDVLKELFGANIPAEAVELAMSPPTGASEEEVMNTLRFIAAFSADSRVPLMFNEIIGVMNKFAGVPILEQMDPEKRASYTYMMGQGILAGLRAIDGAKE